MPNETQVYLDYSATTPLDPEALAELRTIIDDAADATPTDVPGLDRIEQWPASLVHALDSLAFLRRSFRDDPSDRFLEKLRRVTLLEVSEAGRYQGQYRLANLERFFRRLQSALDEQGGDVQAVLRALRSRIAKAAEEDEGMPEGAAEDAVQVLTIHGAKGLEFRHVYLPQLHAFPPPGSWPDSAFDTRRDETKPRQYILFGCPTPGYAEVRQRQRAISTAERVRTLYVAMTRARERLVMTGRWPRTLSAMDKRTDLFLLRKRPGLPESLDEVLAASQTATGRTVEIEGVQWSFPRPAANGPIEARNRSTTANLPGKKVIREQTRALAEDRRQARSTMQRAFSAAASAESAYRLARMQSLENPVEREPGNRNVALAIGESFHRMLEIWNLEASSPDELERLSKAGRDHLFQLVGPTGVDPARQGLDELMRRFARGRLFERWCEIAPHIVGREVPVILPPGEGDNAPVGYISGSIDLLYRDPDTAELVIVDYKTDRVETDEEIAERAAAYRPQEQIYARAVTESLQLDRQPQCQLWFIWPDRLWQYDSGGNR